MTISQDAVNVRKVPDVTTNRKEMKVEENIERISLNGNDCIIKPQVSLSSYTSYRVGGPAEWFVAPRSLESLEASVQYAKEHDLSITLLGAGSNLLIGDSGRPG